MQIKLTLADLREEVSRYYKENKKLPKELIFGHEHFMYFIQIFQDMGRIIPKDFDGVPYSKNNTIYGFYFKI